MGGTRSVAGAGRVSGDRFGTGGCCRWHSQFWPKGASDLMDEKVPVCVSVGKGSEGARERACVGTGAPSSSVMLYG